VRRRLHFTIDEWTALPWWQRRVYLEGMQEEAEQRETAAGGGDAPTQLADAILGGSLDDVRAAQLG
jgi:hypothetical protein